MLHLVSDTELQTMMLSLFFYMNDKTGADNGQVNCNRGAMKAPAHIWLQSAALSWISLPLSLSLSLALITKAQTNYWKILNMQFPVRLSKWVADKHFTFNDIVQLLDCNIVIFGWNNQCWE